MQNYAQNNFKDSAIAKEGKGNNKALVIVTTLMFFAVVAAFKHAIGG
jgi:hypothetical protein